MLHSSIDNPLIGANPYHNAHNETRMPDQTWAFWPTAGITAMNAASADIVAGDGAETVLNSYT